VNKIERGGMGEREEGRGGVTLAWVNLKEDEWAKRETDGFRGGEMCFRTRGSGAGCCL